MVRVSRPKRVLAARGSAGSDLSQLNGVSAAAGPVGSDLGRGVLRLAGSRPGGPLWLSRPVGGRVGGLVGEPVLDAGEVEEAGDGAVGDGQSEGQLSGGADVPRLEETRPDESMNPTAVRSSTTPPAWSRAAVLSAASKAAISLGAVARSSSPEIAPRSVPACGVNWAVNWGSLTGRVRPGRRRRLGLLPSRWRCRGGRRLLLPGGRRAAGGVGGWRRRRSRRARRLLRAARR